MLFTELKTQNNEIDSILEESHWVLLIPDLIFSTVLDPGSVIIDCGDKHYNKGSMRLDIHYR